MSICASIYSSIWQHAVCRQIRYEVRLFLQPLLRDFEETGSFSWDSVVLGCLYRKLCQATSLDSSQIANPLVFLQVKDNCHPQLPDIILLFQKHAQLLQTWTWERIHVGCPQRLMLWRARHSSELICLTIPWHASENTPYPGRKPIACASILHRRTGQDVVDQFIQQPYSIQILHDNPILGQESDPVRYCSIDQLLSDRMALPRSSDEAIRTPSNTSHNRGTQAWHCMALIDMVNLPVPIGQ